MNFETFNGNGLEKKEQGYYRRQEQDFVINNPEYVGINFDHRTLIDSRSFMSEEDLLEYYGEKHKTPISNFTEEQQEQILKIREDENNKKNAFEEYISGFKGKLIHARIHPLPENSPLSVSQAIKEKSDSSFEVQIFPDFIEQMKKIKEHTKDLTIVVPFYNHRLDKEKASDVPETDSQINQYIAICESIIENIGEDIQLEIGNETNVSNITGEEFKNNAQFSSHVDAKEYSDFLFVVASELKKKHKNLRISMAGVACFDPTYIKDTLLEVEKKKSENNIETSLVDTISFHPYRKNPEDGSAEIKNGGFVNSDLNYEKQLEIMKEIALEFTKKLTVGEINFPFTDPEAGEKLEQAISLTAEEGIETCIYPGDGVG